MTSKTESSSSPSPLSQLSLASAYVKQPKFQIPKALHKQEDKSSPKIEIKHIRYPLLTRSEVSQHNTSRSLYLIVHQRVYDLTSYLNLHPGGRKLLLQHAGKDATSDFEALFHSNRARATLDAYWIADLAEGNAVRYTEKRRPRNLSAAIKSDRLFVEPPVSIEARSQQRSSSGVLVNSPSLAIRLQPPPPDNNTMNSTNQSTNRVSSQSDYPASHTNLRPSLQNPVDAYLKLVGRRQLTPNTSLLSYEQVAQPGSSNLSVHYDRLKLPVGHHLRVSRERDDELPEERSYSPIYCHDGCVEILVKRYAYGEFSRFLCDSPIGSVTHFRGSFGKMVYKPNMYERVVCFCFGTGIAPIYQVIKAVMTGRQPDMSENEERDATHIDLVYASRHEDDIILKQELDELKTLKPEQLHIEYVLSQPRDKTYPFTGHIDRARVEEYIQRLKHHIKSAGKFGILICGSEMFNGNCKEWLHQLAINQSNIHFF